MYYQGRDDLDETSIIFTDTNPIKKENIKSSPLKLRFKSDEDFVFSYSFIDYYDKAADQNKEWKNERKVMENIAISEVINKSPGNEKLKLYGITFKPNYKMSSTNYIIVIAPKNEKYTNATLSNPCFITKLVTDKDENVKIINHVDIGENDLIEVIVDLTDIITSTNEFVVSIISQELRFDKKINYYPPYEYPQVKKIDFISEQEFNIERNEEHFELSYEKQTNKSEILILNYKFAQKYSFIIEVYGPNNSKIAIKRNDDEGYVNFLSEESASYRIDFYIDETQKLRNLNDNINGIFKMLSSEYPFNLDITKDKIEFNELSITGKESPSLKFNVETKEKDYIKKIEIANINFDEINKIVSINKNNEEYKTLNFAYFTFEKDNNYSVIINFNKKGENKFTFEKTNIKSFSSDNIKDFALGSIMYDNEDDKFLIIDWEKYKKNIKITTEGNNVKFLVSNLNEDQKNNLIKEFQNLKFSRLENLNIIRPENTKYSVLLIELNQKETKIKFEEDSSMPTLYIVLIAVVGCILLLILLLIIFIIIRHCKKKNKNDITRESLESIKNVDNEQLLKEL
jgi:hypothetical protein